MSAVTVTKLSAVRQPHTILEGYKGYGVFEVDFSKSENQIDIPTGDTYTIQVAPVKKGTLVQNVYFIVETAEGVSIAAEVGDGDDPDGYIDGAVAGIDLNSTGLYVGNGAFNDAGNTAKGKLYAADDTIDIVIPNSSGSTYSLNSGKIKLIVEYFLTKGNNLE
jgi:hypothetical protein